MADVFAALAESNDLIDRPGVSDDGAPERSLYSADMIYRYAFGRWWGEPGPGDTWVWVLLNPATGDTDGRPRRTLSRCITWSKAAGATGLVILNLFALRDTNPKNLKRAVDPVGPCNDEVLQVLTGVSARTIAAWGRGGRLHGRSRQVGPLLNGPLCLGRTMHGEPRHPLLVPGDTQFIPWMPPSV